LNRIFKFIKVPYIWKAAPNLQLFDIFYTEFIDRHCRSSVVDIGRQIAMSACGCRAHVCNRHCRTIDCRNKNGVVSLSGFATNEESMLLTQYSDGGYCIVGWGLRRFFLLQPIVCCIF
jgi:hypothetical protein